MSADSTARKQVGRPFEPGESGNPAGRPKGSRNKLSEAFVTDLFETWQTHGRKAIERVVNETPAAYLKVVASLVPRELKVTSEDRFAGMSDEDLEAAIGILDRVIREQRDTAKSAPDLGMAH